MSKLCMIILNYNDWPTALSLADEVKGFGCLDSIVVVDNHSTDDSWEHLKPLEENEKCPFPFGSGLCTGGQSGYSCDGGMYPAGEVCPGSYTPGSCGFSQGEIAGGGRAVLLLDPSSPVEGSSGHRPCDEKAFPLHPERASLRAGTGRRQRLPSGRGCAGILFYGEAFYVFRAGAKGII